QGQELALGHAQVDVVQHLDLLLAALVDLRDVADFDQCSHLAVAPSGSRPRPRGLFQCEASPGCTAAPSCSAAGGRSSTRSLAAMPAGIDFIVPTPCAAGAPARSRALPSTTTKTAACPPRCTTAWAGTSAPRTAGACAGAAPSFFARKETRTPMSGTRRAS